MKAERIIAFIGTVLTGVMGLIFSVIFAATAISATSAEVTMLFSVLATLMTAAVVFAAVQITMDIKEWF